MGRKPYSEAVRNEKRQEIMDSAEALAREGGLSAVTMRTVGGRLGISSMTIYLYFGSRDDLLGEVAARGYGALIGDLAGVPVGGKGKDRLKALMASYLAWSRSNAQLFEVMHSGEASGHALVHKAQSQVAEVFASAVKDIMGAGAKEDAVVAGVQCTLDLLVSVVFRTQGDDASHKAADGRVLAFVTGGLVGLSAAA